MVQSLPFDGMSDVTELLWMHPRTSISVGTILFTLLTIKLFTTVRFYQQISRNRHASHPVSPPEVPYSLPFLKNGPLFLSLRGNLEKLIRAHPKEAILTLNVSHTRHHIITSPSINHQMSVSKTIIHKLSIVPFVFRLLEYFWQDGGRIRALPQSVYDETYRALTRMMHATFINDFVPAMASLLSTQTADLISFSSSVVDQHQWERASNVHVDPAAKVATASLFPLIRHFTADLASDVFFSSDIRTNFPEISNDLFLLDTKFEPFMAGLPQWLPSNISAARARDRVVEAMRQHSLAYWKLHNGEDPGAMWSNVGRTCTPVGDRVVSVGRGTSDFDPSKPEDDQGLITAFSNAVLIWGLQVNAPNVVFWLVYYIYSDPQLLAEVRSEIKGFVTVEQSSFSSPQEHGGSGITEPPRLKINHNALRASKLLLGIMREVFRMETESITYKLITEDFTVAESADDAAIYRPGSNTKPQTYLLKKGEFIIVPHAVHHGDERYFPTPTVFDAKRFWVPIAGSTETESQSTTKDEKSEPKAMRPEDYEVSYLTSHPWGGGTFKISCYKTQVGK